MQASLITGKWDCEMYKHVYYARLYFRKSKNDHLFQFSSYPKKPYKPVFQVNFIWFVGVSGADNDFWIFLHHIQVKYMFT